MILDRNENKDVAVLLGAGSMGMAILRRVAAGKKILLGGRQQSSLGRAAGAYLLGPDAGFVTGTDLLIDGGTIAALKSGLKDSCVFCPSIWNKISRRITRPEFLEVPLSGVNALRSKHYNP